MDITDLLEGNKKGNRVFPAIRLRRAQKRYYEKDKKWNGRMPASGLSFTSCPYEYYYEPKENEFAYIDKEQLDYLGEQGKYKHNEFQEELRRLKGKAKVKLYPPPHIDQIHKSCQFKYNVNQRYGLEPIDTIELPFFYEPYNMMGFLDAVVSITDLEGPVILDFKNKHVNDRSTWKNFAKNMLPDESNVAQLAAYKYTINKLGYFKEKVKYVCLAYYNVPLVGSLDAEWEYYLNPPEDLTEYLLDSRNKQRVLFLAGKDSSCDYEFCDKHGTKKLFVRDWVIK